jgi:3-oxoacyl-[acyl-carrier protein] reductase
MSDGKELAGEIALVTGGSRGIGRSIAESLASAGAQVVVVARNAEGAMEAAAALPGGPHLGLACDVSNGGAVTEVVARVTDELGPVSILVNNAGITRDNLLLRMKEDDWDAVMSVNLRGAYNTVKAVAKGMMKRRGGVIINITSVVGLIGNAGQANYAASKAGLVGFTKSVARELASRSIRCNAVAPGYIRTDMTSELGDAQTEALQASIPMGRLGEPEDIAEVVRFLAGPSARYITGQVLAVDGGMVM